MTRTELEKLARIKKRIDWLTVRIEQEKRTKRLSFDESERSALLWLIEEAGLEDEFTKLYAEQRAEREGN